MSKRKLSKLLSDVANREEQEKKDDGRRLIERIIKRPIRSGKKLPDEPSKKYSPWSRDMLLGRLAAYSYKRWNIDGTNKLINAAECAKHGWTCVEGAHVNTVQCVYCLAMLNVNIGDNAQTQQLLSEKYRSKIVRDAHKPGCAWVKRPCDDALYDSLAPSRAQQENLQARRTRLGELNDDDDTQFIFPEAAQTVADRGARLALLGWQVDTVLNNGMAVLKCEACFRRITIPKSQFDVSAEHMAYCPYTKPSEWQKLLACMNNEVSPSGSLSLAQQSPPSDSSSYKERLSKLRKIYFHR